MLEVLPTFDPTRTSRLRSRRGVAIAAVTVASLGVGGLVAAGPGFFQAAADRPTVAPASTIAPVSTADVEDHQGDDEDDQGDHEDGRGNFGSIPPVGTATPARSEIDCPGESHGETVSSIAVATDPGPDHGRIVSEAARSGCEDEGSAGSNEIECGGRTHGDTVSSTAHATRTSVEPGSHGGSGIGETVTEAARSDCGKRDSDDVGTAVDRRSEAPGQTGETPGQTGEAPGQTGETPGLSRDLPAPAVDTPDHPPGTPRTTTP